ncbi:hypothetical protein [Pseudofrankia sp. BMG5.37]|nr:hypothetical protein [Pseudofrankia sp. BMG5.37]MDT3439294.1 hypothetical protein [Pseudofrankia sp. BMG5.37]
MRQVIAVEFGVGYTEAGGVVPA